MKKGNGHNYYRSLELKYLLDIYSVRIIDLLDYK